jgi:hypothetical protein
MSVADTADRRARAGALVKSTGPECWQGNYSSPALKNNT